MSRLENRAMRKKSTLTLAVMAATLGLPMTTQQASASDYGIFDGFIKDSKANLGFKTFYMNQDDRNSDRPRIDEAGQAFLFEYKSGFTDGFIGFGLDVIAQEGVRIDSGGRAGKAGAERAPGGGSMFPLTSGGKSRQDFGRINGTGKIRISKTIAEAGVLRPKLPILKANDGRLLPQLFHGAQVTSKEFKNLTFIGGRIEHSTERNSTDSQALFIAGAKNDQRSNEFYYGGVDFQATKDLMLQYYYSNLDDFYEQHFFGLVHNWKLPIGALKSDFRYWTSNSDGANGKASGRAAGYTSNGYWSSGNSDKGEVDNDTWSAMFTYTLGGHALAAGYQKVTGHSDFPYLNMGGASTPLITDSVNEKFVRAGEKTWVGSYTYNFAAIGVPGLSTGLQYYSGDGINAQGHDQEEWERDFRIDYVVPSGFLKGVGVTWRNSVSRGDFRERDDNRVYLTYNLTLL